MTAQEFAKSNLFKDATDPTEDMEEDTNGDDVPNPHLTWGEVRQVMTRPE
jgi:hypothetical protein